MPMLNAENADTDYLQTLIKSVLKNTPVQQEDFDVLCEMIINHCKSLFNELKKFILDKSNFLYYYSLVKVNFRKELLP